MAKNWIPISVALRAGREESINHLYGKYVFRDEAFNVPGEDTQTGQAVQAFKRYYNVR